LTVEEFLAEWHNERPTILVHTSGSTGQPKPMLVEKRRMEASARITCRFLGLHEGDTALLCMPLDYIAGKMMVVRALTCGLKLIVEEPSSQPLQDSTLSTLHSPLDFAAMVPLQVWNLLQKTPERLRQIRHLLIGGGAINDELAEALKDFPNYVWSTYGMTETLSHIALRRLNGLERSDWYTPFEGVTVSLSDEGCLVIDAPAVHDGPLVTNDIAELSTFNSQLSTQQFRILGRKDNVICSGGIKIQIEEVERLLRPHLAAPFMITKAPDTSFGEQVVLLTESTDIPAIQTCCRRVLPRYWQPRRILSVDHIPMTETGKPARAEAEHLAKGAANPPDTP
jgi:Acyl-CoA synthetases (AMP-forming)/AMP-acid ligases II